MYFTKRAYSAKAVSLLFVDAAYILDLCFLRTILDLFFSLSAALWLTKNQIKS